MPVLCIAELDKLNDGRKEINYKDAIREVCPRGLSSCDDCHSDLIEASCARVEEYAYIIFSNLLKPTP